MKFVAIFKRIPTSTILLTLFTTLLLPLSKDLRAGKNCSGYCSNNSYGNNHTKQDLEIGFYLGACQFNSEYLIYENLEWASFGEYNSSFKGGAGFSLRYGILPWLKGEAGYGYSCLQGEKPISYDSIYQFTSHMHEATISLLFDFIPIILGSENESRFETYLKCGFGWIHMYPSNGFYNENSPTFKIMIPVGGGVGMAIDQSRKIYLHIGYDFRLAYTDQINQQPDSWVLEESGVEKGYIWGGYGIAKVGIHFKLGALKKKRAGMAWLRNY